MERLGITKLLNENGWKAHGKLDMALKTDHESTDHAERGDRIMYEKEGRGKNNITTE